MKSNLAQGDIIYGKNVTVTKNENANIYKSDKEADTSKLASQAQRTVFIIHGHNEAKRRELEHILRGFGLHTIVLSEQTDDGKTIIEKFEYYASQSQFAFALFTYDDIVVNNKEEYLQVRPNVIFELGWFYAKLGRENVMILEQRVSKSNVFSDLQGIVRTQYIENVEEAYKKIQDQLKKSNIL